MDPLLKQALFLYNKIDLERVEEHYGDNQLGILQKITEKAINQGRISDVALMLDRRHDLLDLLKNSKYHTVVDLLNDYIPTNPKLPAIRKYDKFEPAALVNMRSRLSTKNSRALGGFDMSDSVFHKPYFRLSQHGFSLKKNVKVMRQYSSRTIDRFMECVYRSGKAEVGFDTESSPAECQ